MPDKPKRVKLIHVPIYESDEMILKQMPPSSVNQWARQLMLRQLQMEEQMAQSFGKAVAGEELFRTEVKQFIQQEIEPLLARLDDSMDALISDKLTSLKPTLLESLEETLLQTLVTKPMSPGNTEPFGSTTTGDDGVPKWRRGSGGNLMSSD